MSDALFFRVLDPAPEEKGTRLAQQIAEYRNEAVNESTDVFAVNTEKFSVVPESPFAYWVDDSIRENFREFPPLEGNLGTVKVGLQTSDNFRFLRTWWEVDPRKIGSTRNHSRSGRGWIHFASGGEYAPYFVDISLVVNWFGDGEELKNFERAYIRNEDQYFQPGVIFSRRSQRFAGSPLPQGCIFSNGIQAAVPYDSAKLPDLVGLFCSDVYFFFLALHLGKIETEPQYEVGVVGAVPVPEQDFPEEVRHRIRKAIEAARLRKATKETEHTFSGPEWASLPSRGDDASGPTSRSAEERDAISEINEYVYRHYGLSDEHSRKTISRELRKSAVAHLDTAESEQARSTESYARLLSWTVGVAVGRWDIRMATDPSLIPEAPEPFGRLPRVSPVGLVGPDGLPAGPERIASIAWLRSRRDMDHLPTDQEVDGSSVVKAEEYPIGVAWDGVLVDDPDHPRDIVGKVREVLRYLYGAGRAEGIEEEALEILRADGRTPGSLRDWFRNRTAAQLGHSFFDFHVRCYSDSRRKAPIYWRLCSNPGRGQSQYAVWLYYHRLTDDTLWTVLNSYLGPKVERVEQRAEKLRSEIEKTEGSEARRLEKEREEALDLVEGLRWFESELRTVAEAGWTPELDDGVVINVAPFHKLMRWNEPEKHWKRLQKGDYDWSLTAMRYWPDRVREKCKTDRSLAIAHGLEELYEQG